MLGPLKSMRDAKITKSGFLRCARERGGEEMLHVTFELDLEFGRFQLNRFSRSYHKSITLI